MFPNREIVEQVKKEYPIGTRVELVRMDDFQAPPVGTKGTVRGVDDCASVLILWDNGSSLSAVYGEDIIKKLETVTTVCYGKTDIWDSREEALKFFTKACMNSEGSEQSRYQKICTELKLDFKICTDEEE